MSSVMDICSGRPPAARMASTKTLAISSLGESVSLKNGFASSQRGATRMSGRSAGATSTCGVYDDEVRVPIIGITFEFR